MPGHWQRTALSAALLLAGLLGVAALLALAGGAVMLPQAGLFVWIALGLLAFLAAQLLMFRLLGLRSPADEDGAGERQSRDAAVPGAGSGDGRPSGTDGPAMSGGRGEPDEDPGPQAPHDADWRAWRG